MAKAWLTQRLLSFGVGNVTYAVTSFVFSATTFVRFGLAASDPDAGASRTSAASTPTQIVAVSRSGRSTVRDDTRPLAGRQTRAAGTLSRSWPGRTGPS